MYDLIYDDSKIIKGDIVEAHGSTSEQYTKGNLYIVRSMSMGVLVTVMDDEGSDSNGWSKSYFRKVKTLPGRSHQLGDIIICIGDDDGVAKGSTTLGMVTKSYGATLNPEHIYWHKNKQRFYYPRQYNCGE